MLGSILGVTKGDTRSLGETSSDNTTRVYTAEGLCCDHGLGSRV